MMCLHADDSEEGDFFYNEEEVLNGIGAENRAALLERYDALLDESEQPELEEVHLPCCTYAEIAMSASAVAPAAGSMGCEHVCDHVCCSRVCLLGSCR